MDAAEIIDALNSRSWELKLSQEHLTKRTGIAQANISRIFTRKSRPKLDTICKLVDALDLELVLIEKQTDVTERQTDDG